MQINTFQTVWKAYTHKDLIVQSDFKDIVDLLKKSQCELVNKEDGMLFNMCSWINDFENPSEFNTKNKKINFYPFQRTELIRRCKDNVDMIYALLLDVDGTMTLEKTVDKWGDYEFFVYSSFSNTKEKEKFRLVVPLKTPLNANEFNSRHPAMCKLFNVDGASFTMSQCFYYPSYSKSNKDISFMHYNEVNNRYDALQIKPIKINTNALVNYTPPGEMTAMGQVIYKTLMTGNNLHLHDVMPLAVLCKSYGIGFSDFVNIVTKTGATGSSVRSKNTNLKELYNKAYQTHMTHKKSTDLMQRIGCNIWRFK